MVMSKIELASPKTLLQQHMYGMCLVNVLTRLWVPSAARDTPSRSPSIIDSPLYVMEPPLALCHVPAGDNLVWSQQEGEQRSGD